MPTRVFVFLVAIVAAGTSPGQTGPMWEQLAPPPGRAAGVAYDPGRNEVVLVEQSFTADDVRTWAWDGSWRLVSIDGPGPRVATAMTFDPTTGVILLVGGRTRTGSPLNDVWAWDGSAWSPRTNNGLVPRSGHVLTFDTSRGRPVVMGGNSNGLPVSFAFVQEWDGAQWVTVGSDPGSDLSGVAAGGCYHPGLGQSVFFEGTRTFGWDGAVWTQIADGTGGTQRYAARLAYDSARDALVLFSGYDEFATDLSDTWELHGNAWTQVSTAAPACATRCYESLMAYHTGLGRTVLYSGPTGNQLADTWGWDGSAWARESAVPWPPARQTASAASAPDGGFWIYGGATNTAVLSDFWRWDGGWELLISPPGARSFAALHAAPQGSGLLLYGGREVTTWQADTWLWDGVTWTELASAGPALEFPSMTQAPASGDLLLHGAASGSGETWRWTGSSWELVAGNGPVLEAIVADPGRGQILGLESLATPGDALRSWGFDGNQWALLDPNGPEKRTGFVLALDPRRNIPVLYGGRFGDPFFETYEWSGTNWILVEPSDQPGVDSGAAFANDADAEALVLFGGRRGTGSSQTVVNEMWLYRNDAVPELPDLAVTSVASDATASGGGEVQVAWEVSNLSAAAATGSWLDRVTLLRDPNDPTGVVLGDFPTGPVGGGAVVSRAESIAVPDDLVGDYYVRVTTNVTGQLDEDNLDNNQRTSANPLVVVPAGLPDLEPMNLEVLPVALGGELTVASWQVRNAGPAAAAGAWRDRLVLSTDQELDTDDVELLAVEIEGPLDPNAVYTRAVDLPVPDSPGSYYLILELDADDEVRELAGPAGNTIVVPFEILAVPEPDLVVTLIDAPGDGVVSGSTTSVTYRVSNVGSGPTDASNWTDLVILSVDDVDLAPNGFLVNERTLASLPNPRYLPAGESYTTTAEIELPPDILGPYYLAVYADGRADGRRDAAFSVSERNEANNYSFSSAFDVSLEPQPDLIAESLAIVSPVFAGEAVPISFEVVNVGGAATDSGLWSIEIYLSSDDTPEINAADRRIGVIDGDGPAFLLSDGERLPLELLGVIPPDLAGSFYLKVVVDTNDTVSEVGFEGNNVAVLSSPVEVIETPAPDLGFSGPIALDGAPYTRGHEVALTWSVENVSAAAPPGPLAWDDAVWLSNDETLEPNADVLLGGYPRVTLNVPGMPPVIEPYTVERLVRLPENAEPGPHFLLVRIDNGDTVFEGRDGGEENNLAAVALVIDAQSADLTVDVDFDPEDQNPPVVSGGDEVLLRWRIANVGTAPTPVSSWVDSVWLSSDDELGDDILLVNVTRNGVLPAGGSYVVEASANIPPVPAGAWNFVFVADSQDAVFEDGAEAAGNALFVPVQVTDDLPDLVIESIEVDADALAGETLDLSWTVANRGNRSVSAAAWRDHVFLSRDAVIDPNDLLLTVATRTGPRDPNAVLPLTARVDLPAELTGPYRVIVWTDADGAVTEREETNNLGVADDVLVVATDTPADLVVDSVTAPAQALSGQLLNVAWRVRNAGAGATATDRWQDAVYLSRDVFLDPGLDRHLGTVSRTGGLPAGGAYEVQAAFETPLGINGPYYVLVVTDVLDDVFESPVNPGNSAAVLTEFLVPGPTDLAIESKSIIAPATATLGGPLSLQWAVRNASNAPAGGSWEDAIYLSEDPAWDIEDVRLGAVVSAGEPLDPNQQRLVAADLLVRDVSPGAYHVLVRTDIRNQVPETHEDNNLAASIGQVTVSVTPLVAGQPVEFSLGVGQQRYFELTGVASGDTVRLSLGHAAATAITDFYLRQGDVPSPGRFDLLSVDVGPDQEVVIPRIGDGPWYLLARATAFAFPPLDRATLHADVLPFEVDSVTPDRIGAAEVTVEVSGARFTPQAEFVLRQVGTAESVAPLVTVLRSASRAGLLFDLHGMATGAWQLLARPTPEAPFVEGPLLLIEPVDPIQVRAELVSPGPLRAGVSGRLTLEVRNESNANIPYVLGGLGLRADEILAVRSPTLPDSELETNDAGVHHASFLLRDLAPREARRVLIDVTGAPGQLLLTAPLRLLERDEFVPEFVEPIAAAVRQRMIEDPQVPSPLPEVLSDPTIFVDFVIAYFDQEGLLGPSIAVDGESVGRDISVPVAPVRWGCQSLRAICLAIPGWWGLGDTLVTDICGRWAQACVERNCGLPLNSPLRGYCDGEIYISSSECWLIPWVVYRSSATGVGSDILQPKRLCEFIRGAFDPNQKSGSTGFGAERFVTPVRPIAYHVDFENLPDASAPAARIEIRDRIDPALAIGTFRLGDIRFGETNIEVPDGRLNYRARVDLQAERGVFVDITAGVDVATREAFWILQAIDPATGEPPLSASLGLLPPNDPNDPSGPGQGWVEFTVQAIDDVLTGTKLRNDASIVFDVNAAIVTNTVTNTIDADAPTTMLMSLPATTADPLLPLTWSGSDPPGGSGLLETLVYATEDAGPPRPIARFDAVDRSGTWRAQGGGQYDLYSIASDYAGNLESPPDQPDARTRVAVQVPAAPLVESVTANRITFQSLGRANVARVEHAVQERASGLYVQSDGRLGAPAFWQPATNWAGRAVTGLAADTEYRFASLARDSVAEAGPGPETVVRTSRAGDADGDGAVNLEDLAEVLGGFGSCEGDPAYILAGDFNGDGCVSLTDLAIVLANFDG